MTHFLNALINARNQYEANKRWMVVVENHTKEFVTLWGSTYAIENDGNICGLCRNKKDWLNGNEILKLAINKGGKKLQAFGEGLFKFYTKNGFVPVSWVKFDEKKAPKDWKLEFGKEPLIFYAYNKNKTDYLIPFVSFISKETPCETFEQAYIKRDQWIYQNGE